VSSLITILRRNVHRAEQSHSDLKRKNSWQSQWVPFATTNKCCKARAKSNSGKNKCHMPRARSGSSKIIADAGSSQRSKSWSSHIYNTCTLFQVKRNFLTVKIPEIRASFIFPDTNFNTEIPDMSGKFQTYGNPMSRHHICRTNKTEDHFHFQGISALITQSGQHFYAWMGYTRKQHLVET